MADMTTIKGKIRDTIYPNGTGAITADKHQALLLEMVDDINTNKADVEALTALEQSLTLKADKSEVASQLTKLSDRIDNLPKGDEFDKQGNYPLLHVGTADDLAGRGESVPASFGFRASGGKSIKDGRAYIKRIKGNSVVWNQIIGNNTFENGLHNWFAFNDASQISVAEDGSLLVESIADDNYLAFHYGTYLESNHKYLLYMDFKPSVAKRGGFHIGGQTVTYNVTSTNRQCALSIVTPSRNATYVVFYPILEGAVGDYANVYNVRGYDLTKMFGAGNEPTTIEEFNARVATLGVDMNAYNKGQVIHCNTESIKSVGDNAWDEEWELGNIDGNTGELTRGNYVRSKNPIPIIGGEQYWCNKRALLAYNGLFCYDSEGAFIQRVDSDTGYYTLPQNAAFIRFRMSSTYGTTYNHDIMITLVHSGWKQDTDAGYQPYWQDTLPLPIIQKYFPQGMKKAGTAHDEIRYNKQTNKWEAVQRIGEVDLGTLDWTLTSQQYFRALLPSDSIAPTNTDYNGFVCAKYERVDFNLIYGQNVAFPCFGIPANNPVCCVFDSSYTDAATFKAAMAGVILYYESNDWEWVELDAEDQNFRDYYQVADFGTEEAIPATDAEGNIIPSANFSADIIYQFNAVDMIREHELEITELQSIIATMQAQLTSLTNGGQ